MLARKRKLHVAQGMYGYDAEYSVVMLTAFSIYMAVAFRRTYDLPRVSIPKLPRRTYEIVCAECRST